LYGVAVYANQGLKLPEQSVNSNDFFWIELDRNESGRIIFPDNAAFSFKKLKNVAIASAWIDHAGLRDFSEPELGQMFGQAASLPENEHRYYWISAEAANSDSAHSAFLNTVVQEGFGWELFAAALPRVAVIDERIQSARHTENRNIELDILWPNMGVWVPIKSKCNLDKPDMEECKAYLKKPSACYDQFPIDFLVIHLTILEGLKKKEGHTNLEETLTKLIESTHASEAHVLVVTGRGVPTVARSLDSDNLHRARYLPISALLESLVLRPSKLALMRAIWSAGCPSKTNE
jgi:hypothetical protein